MPKSRYDLRRKMEVLSVLPIYISYLMIGMLITMTLLALAVILLLRLSAFDPNATKYDYQQWGYRGTVNGQFHRVHILTSILQKYVLMR